MIKNTVLILKGKNNEGKLNTDFPKKLSVPIVSDAECLRTHKAFVQITSLRTFCAGGGMGEGPCEGMILITAFEAFIKILSFI